MKHSLSVTLVLVLMFIVTQVLGVFLLTRSLNISDLNGVVSTSYQDTILGARPDTGAGNAVFMLLFGVFIGTVVLLILIRFQKKKVWKAWFFFAVLVTASVSLGALLPMIGWGAWILGGLLALWKILRPNVIVHNLTEVLTYTGIGLIFAPLLHGSLVWAIVLLGIISLYDMFAVWQSKHMVKMAEFQASSKVFAGLFIPYSGKMQSAPSAPKAVKSETPSQEGPRNAILGGGDLAFPLLFTGVVFEHLVLRGLSVGVAFGLSMFVVAGATLALAGLFVLAKKDRYYPAMPFLSAGCLIGMLFALFV